MDSELGLLPKINTRQRPYYKEHFLPDYATLIYASDAESGVLPNEMLRYCHTMADKLLEFLERKCPVIPEPNNGDENFTGYVWLGFTQEPNQHLQPSVIRC